MNSGETQSRREISRGSQNKRISASARRCRDKFLRFFPNGFADEKYIAWERGYKQAAHERWNEQLNKAEFQTLVRKKEFAEVASRAVKTESPTNLIFSFEKLALRDAVKSPEGAQMFAEGLYEFLHGAGALSEKFERWCATIGALPRKQSRVLTHPVVTVFPFIAQPDTHFFLKPNVTRRAAREYGFDFYYNSKPSWETYRSALEFAEVARRDLKDLQPRDMIDIQSFIWVQGSDEYAEE
jgi:hypothetical protein